MGLQRVWCGAKAGYISALFHTQFGAFSVNFGSLSVNFGEPQHRIRGYARPVKYATAAAAPMCKVDFAPDSG